MKQPPTGSLHTPYCSLSHCLTAYSLAAPLAHCSLFTGPLTGLLSHCSLLHTTPWLTVCPTSSLAHWLTVATADAAAVLNVPCCYCLLLPAVCNFVTAYTIFELDLTQFVLPTPPSWLLPVHPSLHLCAEMPPDPQPCPCPYVNASTILAK